MLPAIALLAAWGGQSWLPMALSRRASLASLLFTAAVAYPFFAQRQLYFSMTPDEAAREIWGDGNPFPEAVAAAGYIRAHTSPNTLIGVLGSEPEIYFYSHRHSATPYIYMYGLMEAQPYALKMQNDVIRDLEAARPEYIVDVDAPNSWLVRDNSNPRILDWWKDYQARNYELAESIHALSIYRRRD